MLWASRQLMEAKRVGLCSSLHSRLRGSHTMRIVDSSPCKLPYKLKHLLHYLFMKPHKMPHCQVMCSKTNQRNPCLMPERLSTTVQCCCEERAHILPEFLCVISFERTHGEVFNECVATRLCATNELCGTFWASVRYVDVGK